MSLHLFSFVLMITAFVASLILELRSLWVGREEYGWTRTHRHNRDTLIGLGLLPLTYLLWNVTASTAVASQWRASQIVHDYPWHSLSIVAVAILAMIFLTRQAARLARAERYLTQKHPNQQLAVTANGTAHAVLIWDGHNPSAGYCGRKLMDYEDPGKSVLVSVPGAYSKKAKRVCTNCLWRVVDELEDTE